MDTEIRHSEATVFVHENGSATWTARIVPTNQSLLNRLADNESLARSVATDSFGVRYGSGIEHELLSTNVTDDAFVIRYRTLDVVRSGPFGTRRLTYFRDSPGAYVYTDLGADELTVVAPPGTTIARGFGEVEDRRMTATELPEVRDGPFVVFTPETSATPGLLATLAVGSALGGVIARNLLLIVAVPGAVLVGGLAAIRRLVDPTVPRNPTRLGGGIVIAGGFLLVGTVVSEADTLPAATGNLLVGGGVAAVLIVFGAAIATPAVRRHLSAGRVLGIGILLAAVGVGIVSSTLGASSFQRSLAFGVAVFPAAIALGWLDAYGGDGSLERRLFAAIAVTVFGGLAVFAPITALGGTLFLLVPILLTVAATVAVGVAVPLYLLGAAGATAETN
jgi:hypothetical protein